jgi:hypothetical protein
MKSKETLRIVIMLMAVAAIPMAVSLLAQGVLQDSTCGVPVTDPCAQQLCPSLPPPPNNQYIGHPCGKIFGLSGTYCIGGSQGATCNWDRQDPAAVYLGGALLHSLGEILVCANQMEQNRTICSSITVLSAVAVE